MEELPAAAGELLELDDAEDELDEDEEDDELDEPRDPGACDGLADDPGSVAPGADRLVGEEAATGAEVFERDKG